VRFIRPNATRWLALLAPLALAACSASDLVKDSYPPNVSPPSALQTEDGAISMYHAAIYAFRQGFGGQCHGTGCYVITSGSFSDELMTGAYITGSSAAALNKDTQAEISARNIPEDANLRTATIEDFYRYLNLARNSATDGIYYLSNFAPFQSKDLIGNMYFIRGMTEIYLADIFCSGIPLSDYKPVSGFIYRDGSSTQQVYENAVLQFDSALANTPDSTTFRYAAQIGKARALLNLGKFAEAAAAVQGVPTTGWQYLARYSGDSQGSFNNNWTNIITTYGSPEQGFGTVGDNEGINGLPYVSANDPRVPTILAPVQDNTYSLTQYRLPKWMFPPATFGGSGTRPWRGESIVVTSGIEARLVEAEVKAQANDPSYLTILNTLRTTCTDVATCATPAPAGTGGVAGLAPLTDPGTKEGRIKQVFDERAYWLFLTGHRQGDLRRLVRVYGWPQNQVYPTGVYPLGETRAYGTFTNLPYPNIEAKINPNYDGCFNRDA
jgi:hypothetical protein